jgi:hypothetical protein
MDLVRVSEEFELSEFELAEDYCTCANILKRNSAFFKEFSLGGQNRKKKQNGKYEPSRFGERASLKRDFVKL